MIRIVKMEFEPQYCESFVQLFATIKEKIRNIDGCESLTLLRDIDNPKIFFTYSHWQDPKYLELYRTSDLFTLTWSTIKPWFASKAEAWSVDVHTYLP
jgi:quinol monooxygenase YgiN